MGRLSMRHGGSSRRGKKLLLYLTSHTQNGTFEQEFRDNFTFSALWSPADSRGYTCELPLSACLHCARNFFAL
jgi:hypothetical protein